MNVFITGSTKGIGKAIAIKMMNLGHNVLVSSRKQLSNNDLKKIFNTNKSIEYIKCDISKENDILNVKKFINEKWGGRLIIL